MEIANFSIELLFFLFFIAIITGMVDTMAGGGGLISIPALILSGIPPLAALGTNKLQGSFGTATATFIMIKNKKVIWDEVKQLMITAFIGSVTGTIALQFINPEVLSFIIPIVLLGIALYFIISPSPKIESGNVKLSHNKFKNIVIPSIGCYDGMFGPGTGSFFVLAGVALKGRNLISSTAMAKPLNLSTNIASLTVFIAAGHIVWIIGALMIIGQTIGAWLGAHCLFKMKPVYIRLIIILMCTGMLIKYCSSMGWFGNF